MRPIGLLIAILLLSCTMQRVKCNLNTRSERFCTKQKIPYGTSGFPPRADWIAVVEEKHGENRTISILDASGKKKILVNGLGISNETSLSWSPSGEEIWFTGSLKNRYALYAVNFSGQLREVMALLRNMDLQDIAPDGTLLVEQQIFQHGILCLAPGEKRERDLSWLDGSVLSDLSVDGKTLTFMETGEAWNPQTPIYFRKTDGSPAVKLGEGGRGSLSPDGKSILYVPSAPPRDFILLPIGPGSGKTLLRITPDGKSYAYTYARGLSSDLYLIEAKNAKS